MNNSFLDFLLKHKFAGILSVIGLIVAILLFTIGFWRTIVLVLILALCFLIGYLLDQSGPEGIREFFNKLFSKKQ